MFADDLHLSTMICREEDLQTFLSIVGAFFDHLKTIHLHLSVEKSVAVISMVGEAANMSEKNVRKNVRRNEMTIEMSENMSEDMSEKDVRRYVRRNDNRNVKKNVRKYVRRYVRKGCQKICQKKRQ